MSGKAILVVGARGMGKTTVNKRLLNKAHIDARLVMDLKAEYKGLYNHAPFYDFESFTKRAIAARGCLILIEEATIHLPVNSNNRDLTRILVDARHYGNTIIMSFHSLQRIPKYVFELSNVLVLHKTGDQIGDVKAFGDPKITDAFIEVEKLPMLSNPSGVSYSPSKIITLY